MAEDGQQYIDLGQGRLKKRILFPMLPKGCATSKLLHKFAPWRRAGLDKVDLPVLAGGEHPRRSRSSGSAAGCGIETIATVAKIVPLPASIVPAIIAVQSDLFASTSPA